MVDSTASIASSTSPSGAWTSATPSDSVVGAMIALQFRAAKITTSTRTRIRMTLRSCIKSGSEPYFLPRTGVHESFIAPKTLPGI
jgi:hypothetical protein